MKNFVKKLFIHTPTWVFLALFLISATTSVFALRHNNQNMIALRSAVYAADKNNGDTNKALNNLRRFVYAHMNTDLSSGGNAIKPPVQLKYTYERLQAGEQKRVDDANSNVYTQAQIYCQQQNSTDFSGRNRVPCVQNYVTTHGEKANSVPVALYQFDFVSPTWSPDLAGWSLVFSIVFLLAFIISLLLDRLVSSNIKKNL
jgi:preprotein translocase subunit SecF